MTHALFLASSRRRRILELRKARRQRAMTQPLRGAAARGMSAKVYCDPRMPGSWAELVD